MTTQTTTTPPGAAPPPDRFPWLTQAAEDFVRDATVALAKAIAGDDLALRTFVSSTLGGLLAIAEDETLIAQAKRLAAVALRQPEHRERLDIVMERAGEYLKFFQKATGVTAVLGDDVRDILDRAGATMEANAATDKDEPGVLDWLLEAAQSTVIPMIIGKHQVPCGSNGLGVGLHGTGPGAPSPFEDLRRTLEKLESMGQTKAAAATLWWWLFDKGAIEIASAGDGSTNEPALDMILVPEEYRSTWETITIWAEEREKAKAEGRRPGEPAAASADPEAGAKL